MIKRIALLTLLVAPLWLSAQVRTEKLLEKRWKFTREDNPEFKTSQFDDTKWQSVCIPHDWAIYGPFSINNDKQNTAIVQDGQKEAMEHAGRTGGLPFVGTGWYRLRFDVPEYTDGKKCTLVSVCQVFPPATTVSTSTEKKQATGLTDITHSLSTHRLS